MLCIYFFIYSLFLLIDRVYSSSEHSIFYLNLRVPRKPNTRKKENQAFLTVLMRKVGDHDLWLHTWGEGLPWGLSGKESTCQGRRPGSDPWVWRIPWRRAWQPTPVFLPGESHGQRCLVGYSPWGRKESNAVHFSRSAVSDSLWPHGLQHARPPCPSSTPGVYSNLRPSSWWCHPTISSSVIPFSSCLQSFPVSESFPMSQFFPTGGQLNRHTFE